MDFSFLLKGLARRLTFIINSLYPERHTSGFEIEEGDKHRDPKFKFQRWIAIEKEQIVAFGQYNQSIWFAHPQKFMLWIGVRSED
jgi:hypothetical protein